MQVGVVGEGIGRLHDGEAGLDEGEDVLPLARFGQALLDGAEGREVLLAAPVLGNGVAEQDV
ncbi:hypothetical protein D9M72_435730 [compost metagenome]